MKTTAMHAGSVTQLHRLIQRRGNGLRNTLTTPPVQAAGSGLLQILLRVILRGDCGNIISFDSCDDTDE